MIAMPGDMEAQSHPVQAPLQGTEEYPGPWKGYSDRPDEMPLSGYVALLGVYAAVFGGLLASATRSERLPQRVDVLDIALFGLASHKIGRIVTRDWVTAPLRAPFTSYVESTGGGEVTERSRGEGMRRAIGDLLTCPWCIAPWIAGSLYVTYIARPPLARFVASLFASVAISDVLQHAYKALRAASR